jgi:drug/metabolite transporter (DMT)-like permease
VPVSAFLLALAAAALHALWNLLIAGARDTEAATAVMLVAAVVLFAPAAIATWEVSGAAVPYMAGSAFLEVAYFALLAQAYRRSELSLVYPLARGSAPLLVLAIAAAALGVHPSAGQAVWVVLVAVGILLVRGLRRTAEAKGAAIALLIGACIAGYTLLDQEGVEHASVLAYLEVVTLPVAICYVGLAAARRGFPALRAGIGLRPVVAASALFGAYTLVLLALRLAPAAPVAAVRESSIVIATALAAIVLRERVSPRRFLGAATVVVGVALVGLS